MPEVCIPDQAAAHAIHERLHEVRRRLGRTFGDGVCVLCSLGQLHRALQETGCDVTYHTVWSWYAQIKLPGERNLRGIEELEIRLGMRG